MSIGVRSIGILPIGGAESEDISTSIVITRNQRYLWEEEPIRRRERIKPRIEKKKKKKQLEQELKEVNNDINKLAYLPAPSIVPEIENILARKEAKRRRLIETILLLAA